MSVTAKTQRSERGEEAPRGGRQEICPRGEKGEARKKRRKKKLKKTKQQPGESGARNGIPHYNPGCCTCTTKCNMDHTPLSGDVGVASPVALSRTIPRSWTFCSAPPCTVPVPVLYLFCYIRLELAGEPLRRALITTCVPAYLLQLQRPSMHPPRLLFFDVAFLSWCWHPATVNGPGESLFAQRTERTREPDPLCFNVTDRTVYGHSAGRRSSLTSGALGLLTSLLQPPAEGV